MSKKDKKQPKPIVIDDKKDYLKTKPTLPKEIRK